MAKNEGQKSSVLRVFQLLCLRTLMHPNKIQIICGHTLARLPRKISAGSAHRGPSNRPRRRSTRAKNGENHRFLTVFQLLRSHTSTHPNEIKIICGHTLARLPRKSSARSAHRGPSNWPRRRSTRAKKGENHRFLMVFQLPDHPNLNRLCRFQRYTFLTMPNVTTESFVTIGQPSSDY